MGHPLVTVAASLAADGKLRFNITEGHIARSSSMAILVRRHRRGS
jgi:hypothetical protein